jgi:nucleotide-binding universal stress UspA family protein
VAVDLTPISDRVVARVARLPLADGARITLLHVVPESLPPGARRGAERDAKQALAEEVTHVSSSLPRGVGIEPLVTAGVADQEIAAAARSAKAELIVLGRGGARALRDAFLGSTAERVIRRSQLPVLVVRLPARAPYRRPALALDFDRAAHDALTLMVRVLSPPRPRVTVLHAVDQPYMRLIYPSVSDEGARRASLELEDRATQRIVKLLGEWVAASGLGRGDAPTFATRIRCGSPRLVVEKAVKTAGTDLLALGTRGRTGAAHVLLGTLAGDVLRSVACDVLVVPPAPPRT